jgi:hypothetical protein
VHQLFFRELLHTLGHLWTDVRSVEQLKDAPPGKIFSAEDVVYADNDPGYQWFALKLLHEQEKKGGCKDGMEMLHLIHLCGQNCVPLPVWLVKELYQRLRKIGSFEENSWDAVLGRPFPKRARRSKLVRESLAGQIYNAVFERHEFEREPIDVGLFEKVGEKFGIKKTLCSQLYYMEKRRRDVAQNDGGSKRVQSEIETSAFEAEMRDRHAAIKQAKA